MATHTSITELRNMQPADLEREAQNKRQTIAKMRLMLQMRADKDSAVYRGEKRELAQILTVLREKKASAGEETALKNAPKSRKVRAPRSK